MSDLINKTFEEVCPHCKRKNKVHILLRETSYNEWRPFHCAYCGLKINNIKAVRTPKSELIDDGTDNAEEKKKIN